MSCGSSPDMGDRSELAWNPSGSWFAFSLHSQAIVPVDMLFNISADLLLTLLSLASQELILLLHVVLRHGELSAPAG